MQKQKGYLVLEDGFTLEGLHFGALTDSLGEIVFNTSMSGYQEVLTDPSYRGQIITMTYPMIGNYGVNDEDIESDRVQVAGFIVREYCNKYSNFRANRSLGQYLTDSGIPALEQIDTRKLTCHIRDKGALRGGIFLHKEGALDKVLAHPSMNGLDLATKVTTQAPYDFGSSASGKPLIAAIDFGIKTNILRLLVQMGFAVRVYPANTSFETMMKDNVKGFFLSNGPGDPEAVTVGIETTKKIIESGLPCFGICLGHQILALALGGKTYKLKFGHRGANQPVKNMDNGRVEITSQNHGFAVDLDSMKDITDVIVTHMNLNDNTAEGIRHKSKPLFSVQYHPEANPGPHDSQYLFEKFYDLVTKSCA